MDTKTEHMDFPTVVADPYLLILPAAPQFLVISYPLVRGLLPLLLRIYLFFHFWR